MKFPFFASFLVFIIWLTYELKKHERLDKKAVQEFWEMERIANETRKKPLDDLVFISIPFEFIPKSLLTDDPIVSECISVLERMADCKIVNLTGYTNTELKAKYGAPNFALLSEYDENFTIFIRTLNKLAHCYYENGYESNARILLEKCVEYGSDIKATYELLAKIYQSHGEKEKLRSLLFSVEKLQSLSQKPIQAMITSIMEESDHTD